MLGLKWYNVLIIEKQTVIDLSTIMAIISTRPIRPLTPLPNFSVHIMMLLESTYFAVNINESFISLSYFISVLLSSIMTVIVSIYNFIYVSR